jgi:hypothetical protein
MRVYVLVLGLSLTACASAGGSSAPSDGPSGDGGDGPPIDAIPIDAPPETAPLSQNVSTTPNGTILGCNQGNFTRENSYYRVFALADHAITTPYQVQSVTFAINTANAGGSSQPGQIKIGRYTGTPGGVTLDTASIVPINSASITIPDGATSITTPISGLVPAGGNLIVELAIPDGVAASNTFFVGTNAAGEAKPGYIRAPACNVLAPTSMNQLGSQQSPPIPKTDLIMTVAGLKY